MKVKNVLFGCIAAAAMSGAMALQVDVVKQGAVKVTVTVEAGGDAGYMSCLKKNLELSGWFKVGPSGTIVVTGTAGGAITATGRGKSVTSREAFSDAAGAHMAARRFSDSIVEAFSDGGKGFATKRIVYVDRKGSDNADLYTCYPDGWDMKVYDASEGEDGIKHAIVGPRWAPNGKDLYFTSFMDGKQLPYCFNLDTRKRRPLGFFKNGASGAAPSPDGRSVALILSYSGNPELYVMDLASRQVTRMTKTPAAAESSPCWSPDGRKIAYVSDQTRNPQIYICDVASRKSTRYTSKGRQNTHPDWSMDGKLCWSSLQAGQWCIMVSTPNGGESSARMVTQPGTWQDPSWAVDGRHLVATRDKALFLVDAEPDGDKPVQLFYNKGNWMNPAFSK